MPHTSNDTEAAWNNSGWHDRVYGWKLHLVSTIARVWITLAVELTPANTADSAVAAALVCRIPAEVRCVVGDRHYATPTLQALYWKYERELVTTRDGR